MILHRPTAPEVLDTRPDLADLSLAAKVLDVLGGSA